MSKLYYSSKTGSLLEPHELPNRNTRSDYVSVISINDQPSRTQQHYKKECDINFILQRYHAHNILPDLIKQNPQFGDFSTAPDYQEALNRVVHAQNQFEALPSKIRARFSNDPSEFLEFATNPENLPEMVKMGLAPEPATTPEPKPQKVVIVNPEDPKTPKS